MVDRIIGDLKRTGIHATDVVVLLNNLGAATALVTDTPLFQLLTLANSRSAGTPLLRCSAFCARDDRLWRLATLVCGLCLSLLCSACDRSCC